MRIGALSRITTSRKVSRDASRQVLKPHLHMKLMTNARLGAERLGKSEAVDAARSFQNTNCLDSFTASVTSFLLREASAFLRSSKSHSLHLKK
jgi:hypothetical protein